MATIIQNNDSKEKFVLLKAKLENNFSNNDFLVADKSGNIFNLKQLDVDRNGEFNPSSWNYYQGNEWELLSEEDKNYRKSKYYNVDNYKVIEIDGKPISELLK